ncbi:MAG: lamin tail domain-containing protein [Myxococcota bacterium]|jgi:hypothetical protein|nr:lamin tail domain-containing protein [Myxococcota bacterium]
MNLQPLRFLILLLVAGTWSCGVEDDPKVQEPSPSPIRFNEVVSAGQDWVELLNTSDESVDLGGYTLSDDGGSWTIPANTVLAGQAYLVIDCDGSGVDGKASIKLSADGETLRLRDTSARLVDELSFPALQEGQSYGRIPNGSGEWTLLEEPTPNASNSGGSSGDCLSSPDELAQWLKLNELLSNSESSADWIELFNTGTRCLALEGYAIKESESDAALVFGPLELGAGEYLMVMADDDAEGEGLHAPFKLSASGEAIALVAPSGELLDSVEFPALALDQSYGRIPNGTGDFELLLQPSPGAANIPNDAPPTLDVVLNEVLSNASNGDSDWLELANRSNEEALLDGCSLQDSTTSWPFPLGTRIPAGSYLLLEADGSGEGLHPSFGLSSNGESLSLICGTGSLDTVEFPALAEDQSYGRIPDQTGPFKTLRTPTPGAANLDDGEPPPPVDVVLNEVVSQAANGASDWIELFNRDVQAAELSGYQLSDSTSTWLFPSGTLLQPGDYLVIEADGSGDGLHASFQLSASGELLSLANAAGEAVDAVELPAMVEGQSFGRIPNGTGPFRLLSQPSKGSVNLEELPAVSLFINEVFSNGSESADWLQIYNAGSEMVRLDGFGLSDQPEAPHAWVFPEGTELPAAAFLLVWADSGGSGEGLHAGFSLSKNGESLSLSRPEADGGALVDSVSVPELDTDLSWGRYPDGSDSLAIFDFPTPAAPNDPTLAVRLAVNELLSTGSPDWIELVNLGRGSVDLQGYALSDDPTQPLRWLIPSGYTIEAGGYLLINADNGATGADFALSANGESLLFSAADGSLLEQLEFPAMEAGESYARSPDGTGEFTISSTPSPGAANP